MTALRAELAEYDRKAAEFERLHASRKPVFEAVDQCTEVTKSILASCKPDVVPLLNPCNLTNDERVHMLAFLQRCAEWAEEDITNEMYAFRQAHHSLARRVAVFNDCGCKELLGAENADKSLLEQDRARVAQIWEKWEQADQLAEKLWDMVRVYRRYVPAAQQPLAAKARRQEQASPRADK